MKLIIAGSRSITDYKHVKEAVIASGLWKKYGKSLEIVCGMASGVDWLGKEFAEKNGLILHKFPADWKTFGKSAGYIRNKQMAEFADCLIAVYDGKSKGTKHMIDIANEKGLGVFVYLVKENK